MSKNSKIILICFLSFLVVLISGFLIFILSYNNNFYAFKFNKNVSTTLDYEEEYDKEFDTINIKTDAVNIEVIESENISKLEVYNEENKINVNDENNILDINIKSKKCIGFCFNIKTSKIKLYLPSNYNKNINIESKYVDIKIGEFENANLNIKNDCGDIKITYINDVYIDSNLGDININKAKKIIIDDDAGDIDINNVLELSIKNNLGDINVKNITNYVDIKTDMGDVKLGEVILNKNSNIETNLGDVKIKNIENVYIDAKTNLGDEKINNNYRKSDIILKIKTDAGDIKVNY